VTVGDWTNPNFTQVLARRRKAMSMFDELLVGISAAKFVPSSCNREFPASSAAVATEGSWLGFGFSE
jgi:hypothetical protein